MFCPTGRDRPKETALEAKFGRFWSGCVFLTDASAINSACATHVRETRRKTNCTWQSSSMPGACRYHSRRTAGGGILAVQAVGDTFDETDQQAECGQRHGLSFHFDS